MQYHPIADIFPLMDGSEFDELVADIKAHGQRDPVMTLGGKILDGRNRFRACQKLKMSVVTDEWIPNNGETPLAFVISKNLRRRQLDASQRAMVASKIAQLLQGEKKSNVGNPTATQPEAAKALNVSRDTVIQARKVQDNAAPEVVKAVESGTVSVNDAAAVADKPKPEQRKALAAVNAGKARTLKQAIADETGEVLTDELDQPVPPGLAAVFRGQTEFRGILNQLKEIKARARKLAESPAGRGFRLQQFEVDLDNARRTIRFDMPHAVCPECKGNAKTRRSNCPCKNTGWLNESNYKALSAELRQ